MAKNNITRRALTLFVAGANCVSFFSHRPPIGFVMKAFVFAFLIAAWVSFWRSVADRFHWPAVIRALVPSVLFLAPMAVLQTLDPSFGDGKLDWVGAILILGVISWTCLVSELSSQAGSLRHRFPDTISAERC